MKISPLTRHKVCKSWWCHQMETFSVLLAFCEFPIQRPVTWSFDVSSNLYLNNTLKLIKSLWPNATIWQQRIGSTFAQKWLPGPGPYLMLVLYFLHRASVLSFYIDVVLTLSIKSSGIHQRTISQEVPHPIVTEISLKNIHLKFHSNISGTND